jgi:endonuclease/exonuclease/phosphatase family metal-dependent hydrolase
MPWSPIARQVLRALALAVAVASAGCAAALNYTDPGGPRFAGIFEAPDPDPALRVVSFNIKYSREIARAIRLFEVREELRGADIVALQEMDAPGVDRIARALGLNYVYYPAVRHPGPDHDFGNAVLARWPIVDDGKIVLPHPQRWRKSQRAAVAATVRAPAGDIRVYSVHLETPFGVSGGQRKAQAEAILADALRYPRVVIAGDFNSRAVGQVFDRHGFHWLTRDTGSTISFFSWDHVFVRGLDAREGTGAGVVRDNEGASDHLPVWAVLSAPSAP